MTPARVVRVGLFSMALVACSAPVDPNGSDRPSAPTDQPEAPTPTDRAVPPAEFDPPSAADPLERKAKLTIDEKPGGKKFQGVWLEFENGERWVVDYRPRDPWQSFRDRDVLVVGHCYQPFGQALSATHFEVERLRAASASPGLAPLLSVGASETFKGSFERVDHPAGSKLEGSSELAFRNAAGSRLVIFGEAEPRLGEPVTVIGRRVELDPTYTATTAGLQLWVERVEAADYAPDPNHADTVRPCPGE